MAVDRAVDRVRSRFQVDFQGCRIAGGELGRLGVDAVALDLEGVLLLPSVLDVEGDASRGHRVGHVDGVFDEVHFLRGQRGCRAGGGVVGLRRDQRVHRRTRLRRRVGRRGRLRRRAPGDVVLGLAGGNEKGEAEKSSDAHEGARTQNAGLWSHCAHEAPRTFRYSAAPGSASYGIGVDAPDASTTRTWGNAGVSSDRSCRSRPRSSG